MHTAFQSHVAALLCLVGLTSSHAAKQALQVTSWSKYPGSSTSSEIAGALYITPLIVNGNDTHKLTWKLTGTDDWCGNGTETGDLCGIRIHEGKDCADASTIGGNLHSIDIDDPWTAVRYTSEAGVSTQAVSQNVATGFTTADLLERTVVVYNSVGAGERIACGIVTTVPAIPETQRLAVKTWVKFPGSTWAGNVSGTVTVVPSSAAVVDTVALAWDLKGTDDACPTGSGSTCGIHIHEGKSCDTAAALGGHYYDNVSVSANPWTAMRYSSSAGAAVSTDFSSVLVVGLKRSAMLGRAVVITNSEGVGGGIACGLLEDAVVVPTTTSFLRSVAQLSLAYGGTPISGVAFMLAMLLLQF